MSTAHELITTIGNDTTAARWHQRSGLDMLARWIDRHRRWVLVFIVVIYAAGLSTHWRIGLDNGGYLYLARQAAEGVEWSHPSGLEIAIAPGFPWLVAPVLRIFGSDAIWAVNVLTLAIGLASLALAYWLFHLHAGRRVATMAVLMLAATESYYMACFQPMADLPFMTGMLLLLVGLERFYQRRPVRGASIALMLGGIVLMGLMRNVVLTALAALVLGLGWEAVRQRRWRTLGAVIGAMIVGLVIVRVANPNVSGFELTTDERLLIDLVTVRLPETLSKATTTNLYLLLCEVSSRTALGADMGPWVNLPFGVGFLVIGLALFIRRPVWGILVFGFCVQWLIFYVDRRYFLPILPVLVLGTWMALSAGDRICAGRWYGVVFPIILGMWFGLNLIRVGTIVVEQHHPAYLEFYESGRYSGVDRIAEQIVTHTPEDAVVLADHWFSAPLMYWTRRRTEQFVSAATIDAGELFVVTPLVGPIEETVRAQGWTYGPPIAEVARLGHEEPLVLRRVER